MPRPLSKREGRRRRDRDKEKDRDGKRDRDKGKDRDEGKDKGKGRDVEEGGDEARGRPLEDEDAPRAGIADSPQTPPARAPTTADAQSEGNIEGDHDLVPEVPQHHNQRKPG